MYVCMYVWLLITVSCIGGDFSQTDCYE